MVDAELESAMNEYFAECEEILARVGDLLRAIEHDEFTGEQLDAIYRDIHTVKGTSQLFGFQLVGTLSHAMEASLDPVRRLQRKPSLNQIEALYVALALVEKMIESLKSKDGHDYQAELESVTPQLLDSALELLGPIVSVPRETLPAQLNGPAAAGVSAPISAPVPTAQAATPSAPAVGTTAGSSAAPAVQAPAPAQMSSSPVSAPVTAPVSSPASTVIPTASVAAPVAAAPAQKVSVMASSTPLEKSHETSQAPQSTAAPAAGGGAHGESDSASTIRVPVSLLDKLMTLMGEMVLVRNQVLQYANKSDHLEFLNLSQRLDVVTSEIQGEVMKTRMQPIANVLSKFHRVVRDLSRDLGKKIELVLSGSETEVDKTLLEAVKDPIMHIVRNSCDHGIETIEDRRVAGKPEHGTVTVRSFHEGGQVVIEISDDGRGLNRDKLINKAVEKGLISAEKGQGLSDRDAFNLIFAAGFSTAAAVTNVSGRGVGMDVVKTNIEAIGGMVEVQSTLGHGMKIRLKIPLTLAIVPAMIVRSGTDLFAIPQVKLVELVRVEKGASHNAIEFLQGKPVYRLRGNLLPLVSLDEVLGMKRPENQPESSVTNIVVLNVETQMFGLIVDEVQDTAEVVVKPLSGFLKSLSVYSGATVLGDGSVALILDVMGLAQAKSLLHVAEGEKNAYGAIDEAALSSEDQEFLLFRLNSPTRHSVPLNLVHRLEEFSTKDIEYSGSQRVVRYRDMALPIISMNEQLHLTPAPTAEVTSQAESDEHTMLSVIVMKKNDRLYGLQVDEILDVLKTTSEMDEGVIDRPGVFGNIVTDDEIIVVVDVMQILEKIATKLGSGKESTAPQDRKPVLSGKGISVLFAEDTAFFRKHIRASLEKAGFQVTCAINGQEALDTLNNSSLTKFDLILSDIEMPKLNGLQLASAVRKEAKYAKIPLIALTTKFSPTAQEEGAQAGFDAYLEKLKIEELLETISKLMPNRLSNKRDVA